MTDFSALSLDEKAIRYVRGISMDAPHKANSGHQGTAMALAPLAHVLYSRIMKYDAANPLWPDRDRFVLSPGHASILQYCYLYLAGFGLEMQDLIDFRQWDSKTPGHPEVGHTAGVEITTGPLGQGFAHAVGMAMAEEHLRATRGEAHSDHFTYVICSDGDLAEGVSHEAGSLAGHQKLGRLICVYDDNRISIDGSTDIWLSDNPKKRFRSYGWHVIDLGEKGEDLDAIEAAINEAKAVTDKPSMIILQTHIGFPSPSLIDTPAAHGLAFGDDEIKETKEVLGLDPEVSFAMDDEVLQWYRSIGRRGSDQVKTWYQNNPDEPANPSSSQTDSTLDFEGFLQAMPTWDNGASVATRKASNACLDAAEEVRNDIVAGGADLTGNTGVKLAKAQPFTDTNRAGSQVFYGVREHAMAAAMNGMALHGGVFPVGGTFLVFSDYCRPAVRLAALSGLDVVFSFTHDSVGVGEDGPTHQPIEHVASLRAIPGLRVIRPADAREVAGAWAYALSSSGPVAMILSRQNLPVLKGSQPAKLKDGAYELLANSSAEVTLVSAGSEVSLCIEAIELLEKSGIAARLVSMPCDSLFAESSLETQASLLPVEIPTLAVEAGVSQGWWRWADDVVSIERFGASAPGDVVMDKLGMNAEHVARRAAILIGAELDEPCLSDAVEDSASANTAEAETSAAETAAVSLSTEDVTVGSTKLNELWDEQNQSPWLDNLRRDWIENGELDHWIKRGVRGLTSNPAIFAKSIETVDSYSVQLRDLTSKGTAVHDAYWAMVIKDIEDAAAALDDVFVSSNRLDGWVSVEVDPNLADDTEATVKAAKALRKSIKAENVLIKIPATTAGVAAIEAVVAEGISVNVTLLFSLERYREVIEAYIRGLEACKLDDLSKIASVASFFISRVDTAVDEKLEAIGSAEAKELTGTIATAQAQLAYEMALETFQKERWQALARRGANIQRPLWASTSTKNPAYSDTKYVDDLIGPNSVNTIPDATLSAFLDHGTVARSIDADLALAKKRISSLQGLGIDLEQIANQLERAGVISFVEAFQHLIEVLEMRQNELR